MAGEPPDGLYKQILDSSRETLETGKRYTGLLVLSGLEAVSKASDASIYRDYIDPWNGDKLIAHPWFSKDLSKATWNGTDRIGAYLEDSDHDRIAKAGESLQDPYTKTVLAFGAVSAFTGLKEFWYDGNPNGLDAAANYTGMSYHLLQEHHDIDLLRPVKDLYNEAKDAVTEKTKSAASRLADSPKRYAASDDPLERTALYTTEKRLDSVLDRLEAIDGMEDRGYALKTDIGETSHLRYDGAVRVSVVRDDYAVDGEENLMRIELEAGDKDLQDDLEAAYEEVTAELDERL